MTEHANISEPTDIGTDVPVATVEPRD
ncbi:MAG: hypothetical protein ACI9C3_002993, partial [Yoonia sp.]